MITEQEILEKYPKIFKNKDLDKTQSCMFWGLEVPTAWLPVIDQLCDALQHRGWVGSGGPRNRPQVVADQVKSKFGQLRFYFHLEYDEDWLNTAPEEDKKQTFRKYNDYYQGMIDFADNILYNMEYELIEDENGNKKARRREKPCYQI